jgi:hypothetical protein
MATGHGLDVPGLIPISAKFVFSPQRSDRHRGLLSLLLNGYWGPFHRGVKLEGCEDDHLPPSSAEVKKDGVIPPLPHRSSWNNA